MSPFPAPESKLNFILKVLGRVNDFLLDVRRRYW